MVKEPKPLAVVRIMVVAAVNIASEALLDQVSTQGANISLAEFVAGDIASTLETIPYVETVAVVRL